MTLFLLLHCIGTSAPDSNTSPLTEYPDWVCIPWKFKIAQPLGNNTPANSPILQSAFHFRPSYTYHLKSRPSFGANPPLYNRIIPPRNGPPTLSRLWASHHGPIGRNPLLFPSTCSVRCRAFALFIENPASLICCRTETQSDSPLSVEAPRWLPPTALPSTATPESLTSITSMTVSVASRASLSISSDLSPRRRSRTTWTNSLSGLRSSAL